MYVCVWILGVHGRCRYMCCDWRIPAHMRCIQCSILLHLMDICFLTCICLWQIAQIQTCLFKVVVPGLVSTSPTFVSSSASHPAGPHGRHAQKNGKSGRFDTICTTAPSLIDCVVWSLIHSFLLVIEVYGPIRQSVCFISSLPPVSFRVCD